YDGGRSAASVEGRTIEVVGHKLAHLRFELREQANVMNPLLLVKRRYRLRPHHFAARGVNGLIGNMLVHGPDNIFDQISAVIDFRDDPVGMKLAVRIDCPVAPSVRRQAAAEIPEYISVSIDAPARDHHAIRYQRLNLG